MLNQPKMTINIEMNYEPGKPLHAARVNTILVYKQVKCKLEDLDLLANLSVCYTV